MEDSWAYEHGSDVQRSLGRIEGKLDQVLTRININESRLNAQEVRLGAVEKKTWWAAGAVSVFSFIVTKLFLGDHWKW